MCTHLQKRGAVYYFRRTIPKDLQVAFDGKTQWMHSLGTKDLSEGKRLARLAGTNTDKLIDKATLALATMPLVKPSTGGHWQITEADIAQEKYEEQECFAEEAVYDALTTEAAAHRDELEDMRFRMTIALDQERVAKALLKEERKGIAATNLAAASPPSPVIDPISKGVMLDPTIINLWSAERNTRKKGVDAHRAVARWFHERVGEKPVGEITRADVLTFKAKLVSEGQSAANIKMKLSRLHTILEWSLENGYSVINAAYKVKILNTQAGRNRRREFDLASLNVIFSSRIYTEGYRPTQGRGEAAYW